MTELYLGTMDALWEMTPGLPIFFVEGGGQGGYQGAPPRARAQGLKGGACWQLRLTAQPATPAWGAAHPPSPPPSPS